MVHLSFLKCYSFVYLGILNFLCLYIYVIVFSFDISTYRPLLRVPLLFEHNFYVGNLPYARRVSYTFFSNENLSEEESTLRCLLCASDEGQRFDPLKQTLPHYTHNHQVSLGGQSLSFAWSGAGITCTGHMRMH